jgi:hypothetical protein
VAIDFSGVLTCLGIGHDFLTSCSPLSWIFIFRKNKFCRSHKRHQTIDAVSDMVSFEGKTTSPDSVSFMIFKTRHVLKGRCNTPRIN